MRELSIRLTKELDEIGLDAYIEGLILSGTNMTEVVYLIEGYIRLNAAKYLAKKTSRRISMSRNEFGLDWDSRVSESKDNRTREQTIVWRNDFENIVFKFPKEGGHGGSDWAHSLSDLVIVVYNKGGKSLGNFFKDSGTGVVVFESISGWRSLVKDLNEFAFIE